MIDGLKKWGAPIAAFVAVASIWWWFGGYDKAAANGTDKFDSLNSLFAGLAFVGMLCTLWMQRQELGMQRAQLKENSEELMASRKALEQMANVIKLNQRIQFWQMRLEIYDAWIAGIKRDFEIIKELKKKIPILKCRNMSSELRKRWEICKLKNLKSKGNYISSRNRQLRSKLSGDFFHPKPMPFGAARPAGHGRALVDHARGGVIMRGEHVKGPANVFQTCEQFIIKTDAARAVF